MKNQQAILTPASVVKTNKTIFWAIFGSIFLLTAFFFMNHENEEINFDFKDGNFQISIGLIVLGLFLSQIIFQFLKNRIPKEHGLKEKIMQLQTAYIIRYAILEAPVFLIILVFQNNKSFLFLPAIILLYMLTLIPSKEKIINDLDLNSSENAKMNRENEEL